MKLRNRVTLQILVLASVAGYVGVRTYSVIGRGQNAGSERVRSSRQYAIVQVSDTSGRQLHSLFEGIPVDPRYTKYVHPPKVIACRVRSTVQRASSRLVQGLDRVGLSLDYPVHAQEPCDCGEFPNQSDCADACPGEYWGGPTDPTDDPEIGFTWSITACNNGDRCNEEPHTSPCSCTEGDDPP